MKKYLLIIIILLSCFSIQVVKAGKEDTNLYCEYSDSKNGSSKYYMIIEFTSTNIDNFDYSFKTIPDDVSIVSTFALNNKNDLLANEILTEAGNLRCPDLAIKTSGSNKDKIVLSKNAIKGDKFLYQSADISCPKDDCDFFKDPNNQIIEKPVFSCYYSSKTTSKTFIEVHREQEGGSVYIVHPDGTKEKTSYPFDETCEDFYYNTKNKTIKFARYDYLGKIEQMQTHDPSMYSFVCGSSKEGNKNIEYFCQEGQCKYSNNANISCKEVSSTINKGNINLEEMCNMGGVKNTLRFLGYLLLIVKILVPILLIVFGVIDFSKATVSSDSDSVPKATKTLVIRIIAGLAIFLIPTIVNLVFKGLLNGGASNFNDCRVCIFEPNKCD